MDNLAVASQICLCFFTIYRVQEVAGEGGCQRITKTELALFW
jgi:hypothetical protein